VNQSAWFQPLIERADEVKILVSEFACQLAGWYRCALVTVTPHNSVGLCTLNQIDP
jgi:hypothetical protein